MIRYKILFSICILILIHYLQCFIFKNDNCSRNAIFINLLSVKLAFAYIKVTKCTSSTDDSTCREVITGTLPIVNNAVERLKIIRKGKNVIFVTFRREYVVLSYYLKYLKDIPNYFEEKVETMPHRSYKTYTDEELDKYVHNCFSKDPENAHQSTSGVSADYIKATAGEKCECPKYKMFRQGNTVKRSDLNCNLPTISFYPSTIVFSRHCAFMNPFFYSVYSIEYPPIFNTYVTVTLQEYDVDNDELIKRKTENLVKKELVYTLDDSEKSFRDDYFDITVTLRGERQHKVGLVNLSSDYILLPSSPLHKSTVRESDISSNCGNLQPDALKGCDYTKGLCQPIHPCLKAGMMLSSDNFDMTGNTCGKLGVSYNRWRSPPTGNFCAARAGLCLEARLNAYEYEHAKYSTGGLVSRYKIRNIYGSEPQTRLFDTSNLPGHLKSVVTTTGTPALKISDHSMVIQGKTATHPMFIDYKYNGQHTVDVEFETTANHVYNIQTVANGAITHITPPKNCAADTRNSLDCMLTVHVWNSEKRISANFICSVQCKLKDSKYLVPYIAPIEALEAYIEADKNYAFYFIIKMLTNQPTETHCTAYLLDSNRKVRSQEKFKLESKQIIHIVQKDIRPEEAIVQITKFPEIKLSSTNKDNETCGCGLNLFCYIFGIRRCLKAIFRKIYALIGTVALIVVLVFLTPIILPLLPFIIKICITCCVLPLKILCACFRLRRKFGGVKKKMGFSRKLKSEGRISDKGGFFRKLEKEKKKKKIKEASYSPRKISSSESSESVDSYKLKKKPTKKIKKHYDRSSTSSPSISTISTVSTSSTNTLSSSNDSVHKKSRKQFAKKSDSSSFNSSISLDSSDSSSRHSTKRHKTQSNKKKSKKTKK